MAKPLLSNKPISNRTWINALPCFKSYDLDNTIKELLKTRCCGDSVPAGLVEQIKVQISQNQPS
jgi:hypothetical protein